ncbi:MULTISPECIES: GlxA family transcriptional regulator [Rhodomicrobium]|uniref:GlxA family transcriptional regulator n=1 Tax=Rhodomicrobium TaxID=1068 RepID=UPI000B4BC27F|nr:MULTISPECIES: GlxA family transcriptional regulator [Rhodomicrobium]
MSETDPRRRLFSFYLVPEFTLLAFSSALEALRLANAAVGFEAYAWRFVSEKGKSVRSSCGLDLAAHASLAEERAMLTGRARPTMAIVCGGMNVRSHRSRAAATWLRECRRRGVALASLCTGSDVLAEAGLLDGRRCTIHWENLPDFTERFPAVEVSAGVYEIDGDVYSCAGGSASFDMMLHLIAQDFGEAVVSRICEQALVERVRAPSVRQRLPLRAQLGTSDPAILAAVELMQANMLEPLPLPELAARVGVSIRQVERLFRREMGRSPARYYLELRLERAHHLLSQSALPIIEIAVACGFLAGSHFWHAYRKVYGCTPKQTRIASQSGRPASPPRTRPARAQTADRPVMSELI